MVDRKEVFCVMHDSAFVIYGHMFVMDVMHVFQHEQHSAVGYNYIC